MDRTITSREDGITWIAELLGSEATRDDASLAWAWGRQEGLITHNGQAFEVSEAFDALEVFDEVAPRFVVKAHTGDGENAFVTRNDRGLPCFTFKQPEPLLRWAAESLHRDALRTCGGTLSVVWADA